MRFLIAFFIFLFFLISASKHINPTHSRSTRGGAEGFYQVGLLLEVIFSLQLDGAITSGEGSFKREGL